MTGESSQFPIIDQLQAAPNNRARAELLLKVPDFILVHYGLDIQIALRALNFAGGVQFISERLLAMHQPRDAHGLLPEATARELEHWRQTFVKFAAGEKIEAPDS